jgi:hypothetical protein
VPDGFPDNILHILLSQTVPFVLVGSELTVPREGVCRDAGGLHPVGDPRRGPAPRRRRRAHDVHLPGRARLRHAAAAAHRLPGLRDGLPRRQRLLLLVRLYHALNALQGGQAAGVQGALHHRPGRRCRRGDALRHALGVVL